MDLGSCLNGDENAVMVCHGMLDSILKGDLKENPNADVVFLYKSFWLKNVKRDESFKEERISFTEFTEQQPVNKISWSISTHHLFAWPIRKLVETVYMSFYFVYGRDVCELLSKAVVFLEFDNHQNPELGKSCHEFSKLCKVTQKLQETLEKNFKQEVITPITFASLPATFCYNACNIVSVFVFI